MPSEVLPLVRMDTNSQLVALTAPCDSWDTVSLDSRITINGHLSNVTCIAFSPDGHTLATGGSDLKLRLWDIATGNNSLTLVGHISYIESAAFSPDGKTIATAWGFRRSYRETLGRYHWYT